jgi:hypothetical protein
VEENLKPILRHAIGYLEQNGYRYAVIGGIALSQWGVARYTHDVDIKVFVPDTDYPAIRNRLRSAFLNKLGNTFQRIRFLLPST